MASTTPQPAGPGRGEQIKGQQVELILRQLESLPTLPVVATRLLNLTTSSRSEAREVIQLIQADQALTAKILSLGGRANVAVPKEARTVEKVVLMLGFEAVRSAVLGIKVFEMFDGREDVAGELDQREFWKHCLAVATVAESLAKRLRLDTDPEEVFVCGLLHDLGKLALAQCLPKSYGRVLEACHSQYGNIADHERRVIGADHTIVGRRLGQQWNLPPVVGQAIWLHHQPIEGIPEVLAGRRAIAVVHLADTVAREQRFGYSGNFTFPANSAKLAEQIGVPDGALAEIIEKLPAMIERRAKLLGLAETTSESLFRSALGNANAELARLNQQFSRRARAAATQARAFTLLRDFGGKLSGQETAAQLCVLLADAWAQAGGIRPDPEAPVAAYMFSLAEPTVIMAARLDDDRVELGLLGGGGAEFPPSVAPAEGTAPADAIEQASTELHLAPIDLRGEGLSHRPLLCGRQWIGGLIWPAVAATAELTGEAADALVMSMGFAAGVTAARDRAGVLAEQLSQSAQQLYAAQRSATEARALATVGEMAAGAAHEINNPLAVVAGRAQLMADSATGDDQKTWQSIASQAQRISDIVSEMMEFAKPPAPAPERVTVEALLTAARDAAAVEAKTADLTVELAVGEDVPEVSVDVGQMAGVLIELMANARAAQGEKPRVQLQAVYDDVSDAVLVKVIDGGEGMTEEVMEKAFTPFFSDRPAGRGRGMGLSKARRRVELAGGKIWIASTPGDGTTVFIQLPVAEADQ